MYFGYVCCFLDLVLHLNSDFWGSLGWFMCWMQRDLQRQLLCVKKIAVLSPVSLKRLSPQWLRKGEGHELIIDESLPEQFAACFWLVSTSVVTGWTANLHISHLKADLLFASTLKEAKQWKHRWCILTSYLLHLFCWGKSWYQHNAGM